MSEARRGDIWLVNLEPVIGHEQGRRRRAVILSVDEFNSAASDLVSIVPLTTRDRGLSFHIRLVPPDGGLPEVSFALPEQVRSISGQRLIERWGRLEDASLGAIADWVRVLLGL